MSAKFVSHKGAKTRRGWFAAARPPFLPSLRLIAAGKEECRFAASATSSCLCVFARNKKGHVPPILNNALRRTPNGEKQTARLYECDIRIDNHIAM